MALGLRVGLGVGFGVALGLGVGLGVGFGVGLGVGLGVGFGVGLGVGAVTVMLAGSGLLMERAVPGGGRPPMKAYVWVPAASVVE